MRTLMKQLKEEQLTCIIQQHDRIYAEKRHGILPILHFLEEGKLKDALVADKVIGKAAAMMMVYGGVQAVDTILISEPALRFFQEHVVTVTYETCVPYIINRKMDGMCPMEESVLSITDMSEAYTILQEKVKQLQKMSD